MALCSLSALGGSDERIRAFTQAYVVRLSPLPSDEPAPIVDWQSHTGEPRSFLGLVRFFLGELTQKGRSAVLQALIPKLLPSLRAHAFHGIIRVAYAVRFDTGDEELAHGLAYWVTGVEPEIPLVLDDTPRHRDPRALFDEVRRSRLGAAPQRAPLITDRMRQVAGRAGFAEACASLSSIEQNMPRIVEVLLRAFIASGDFTALHGVTGSHAFRVLDGYLGDRDLAHRHLMQALMASYVVAGVPDLGVPPRSSAPSWDALAEIACGRDDDHDVKLVDSAREEDRHYCEPLARAAAARRLGV